MGAHADGVAVKHLTYDRAKYNRAQSGIVATILRLSAGSIVTRLLVSSIGHSSLVLNVLATIDRPHIALVGIQCEPTETQRPFSFPKSATARNEVR